MEVQDGRRRVIGAMTAVVAAAALAGFAPAADATNAGWISPDGNFNADANPAHPDTNTVTHTGVGDYLVRFPALSPTSNGTVDVTAFASGAINCKPASWSVGGDVVVRVRCFTPAGAPFDSGFSVGYTDGTGEGDGLAYARADQPHASSYTPSLSYQHNSAGGPITVARSAPGQYTVVMPGQALVGGTVKVSALGNGPQACKVAGWGPNGSEEDVYVHCYSKGTLADSKFTVTFSTVGDLLGITNWILTSAAVWADQPSAAATYHPQSQYNLSNVDGPGANTVTRLSTGQYRVHFPHGGATGGVPQVTAYGTSAKRCVLTGYSTGSTSNQVDLYVSCFTARGHLADSQFTAQWATPYYAASGG
jgi:hypothetical protein